MPEFKFDWNVVVEVLIGVILYKIIDSIFDMAYRLIKEFSVKMYKKFVARLQKK